MAANEGFNAFAMHQPWHYTFGTGFASLLKYCYKSRAYGNIADIAGKLREKFVPAKTKSRHRKYVAPEKGQTAGALKLATKKYSIVELKRSLKKGQEHAEKSEWADAVKQLMIAWEAMPEDLSILTILAHALTQLGVREHAIKVLEKTLTYHAPTPDVCSVILQLALDMGFQSIAEKLGHQLIAMEPHVYKHYVNLFTAMNRQEKFDETIEMAQQVIPDVS